MTPSPIRLPMPEHLWVFRADPLKVIDGDTLDVEVDGGFGNRRVERLRLLGVNTPERKGATRATGDAAKAYVEEFLRVALDFRREDGWPLMVQTEQDDAFGRYLAWVWRRLDGACLNSLLLETGHAVPYED